MLDRWKKKYKDKNNNDNNRVKEVCSLLLVKNSNNIDYKKEYI